VNAWIQEERLPVEFRLLRYKPNPWKPKDSIAIGRLMGWDLANWKGDLVMGELVKRWGLEKSQELLPTYEKEEIIKSESDTLNAENRPPQKSFINYKLPFTSNKLPITDYHLPTTKYHSSGGSSNSWIVDGTKSETGKPLLANDPHLPLSLPSQWVEVHLRGGGYDVQGITLPGIPGVIIGHNQKILRDTCGRETGGSWRFKRWR
jgi:penicillin amidase